MNNFLKNPVDYIHVDKFEISQINQIATTPESPNRDELELEMTEIQEERRGITYDNKGKLIFNCNVFSNYCQSRVFAFRKNDSWYLYNHRRCELRK